MNTNTDQILAYYAPDTVDEDTAGHPWLIVVGTQPWTRAADSHLVAEILASAGHNPAEHAILTLGDAVADIDTDGGTVNTGERAVPSSWSLAYAPETVDGPTGRLPWLILDSQGVAVFCVFDGDYALDVLEAIHDRQGDEGEIDAARGRLASLRAGMWEEVITLD